MRRCGDGEGSSCKWCDAVGMRSRAACGGTRGVAVGFCIVCEALDLFDQAVMHAHGLPSRDTIRSVFTQRTVDQISGI